MIQIKKFVATGVVVFSSILALFPSLRAQNAAEELRRTIRSRDTAFWTAYNAYDVDAMAAFFADDVEFYHDKGGPTLGLTNLV